jgi:hypothetical protein
MASRQPLSLRLHFIPVVWLFEDDEDKKTGIEGYTVDDATVGDRVGTTVGRGE